MSSFFFFFARRCRSSSSVSEEHSSAANVASSSVQLHCPKGLAAHTPHNRQDMNIHLVNCWCCIEHHIRSSFHVYYVTRGQRRCPHGSSLLFNRMRPLRWSIFMGEIVLEGQQSQGHKKCWCWVLGMTEVDIRTRIKILQPCGGLSFFFFSLPSLFCKCFDLAPWNVCCIHRATSHWFVLLPFFFFPFLV